MTTQLERLAEWIRGHDCYARVEGDEIVIGSHAVGRDREPFTMIDRVRSLSEARDVLGY
jgi:GGDEF domain-containing protein